jgi:release factor glutamine methyltransferase
LNKSVPWTIKSVLEWTQTYFKEKFVESPRLSAEILLADTLGLERIDLYVQFDRPLDKQELSGFKSKLLRRAQHEPVAYITEKKAFWKSIFVVSPHVLIPRPETELLVEHAISLIHSKQGNMRILELGVGSGAIIVSLATEFPYHIYWGTDYSFPAIQIAKQNAMQNTGCDNRIQFVVSDWFESVSTLQPFDLIISNPPYISREALSKLQPEITRFEPQMALDGGEKGFIHLQTIIEQAANYLSTDGTLLLEIGFDQREFVENCVASGNDFKSVKILKDYAGHDRIACISGVSP